MPRQLAARISHLLPSRSPGPRDIRLTIRFEYQAAMLAEPCQGWPASRNEDVPQAAGARARARATRVLLHSLLVSAGRCARDHYSSMA